MHNLLKWIEIFINKPPCSQGPKKQNTYANIRLLFTSNVKNLVCSDILVSLMLSFTSYNHAVNQCMCF